MSTPIAKNQKTPVFTQKGERVSRCSSVFPRVKSYAHRYSPLNTWPTEDFWSYFLKVCRGGMPTPSLTPWLPTPYKNKLSENLKKGRGVCTLSHWNIKEEDKRGDVVVFYIYFSATDNHSYDHYWEHWKNTVSQKPSLWLKFSRFFVVWILCC